MTVREVLRDFLSDHFDSADSNRLLIGVSGGPDSFALLRGLVQFEADYSLELTAIHVNYHLHDHSSRAEGTLRDWCKNEGIEFVGISSLYRPENSTQQKGEEGFLRRIRFESFVRLSNIYGAQGIVLGHHRDDQVETILHRMARGTGLQGLAGMKPVSSRNDLTVYRPFLSLKKGILRNYCDEYDLPVVEDPSNDSHDYERNALRQRILPEWEVHQPSLRESVVRLGKIARLENQFWEEHLESTVPYRVFGDEVHLARGPFNDCPKAVRARWLQRVPIRHFGMDYGWNFQHVERLIDLCRGRSGRELHLPGGIRASVEYERVAFFPSDTLPLPPRIERTHREKFPIDLTGLGRLRFEESNSSGVFCSKIDYQDLGKFSVRGRENGDQIQQKGSLTPLKEIFQKNHVPYRARPLWPVLVSEHRILCIPGLAVADSIMPSNESTGFVVFESEHPVFRKPDSL